MDTLSWVYSEGGAAVGGGTVYSVIIRPRDDGSYLAICKLDCGARGLFVCYGGGDTPIVALNRLADAMKMKDRWRKDRLERAAF